MVCFPLFMSHLFLQDTRSAIKRLASTTQVIFGFFAFATALSMLISFFALVSSTYVSILEQVRELGILRAVGLGRWPLLRAYAYEALVVVLSAVLLGLLIGAALAYTMSAQRILFSQLPIPFSLPWTLVGGACLLSLLLALAAALLRWIWRERLRGCLRGCLRGWEGVLKEVLRVWFEGLLRALRGFERIFEGF